VSTPNINTVNLVIQRGRTFPVNRKTVVALEPLSRRRKKYFGEPQETLLICIKYSAELKGKANRSQGL
jgi:hypothetical protein